MDSKTTAALAIGFIIPVSIVTIFIFAIYLRRLVISRGGLQGYSQVNHGLDDEEMQFKRSIEMAGSQTGDLDGLFTDESDTEEIQFDNTELDRLNMIEKYRNNLVASAQSLSEAHDDKIEEELRI